MSINEQNELIEENNNHNKDTFDIDIFTGSIENYVSFRELSYDINNIELDSEYIEYIKYLRNHNQELFFKLGNINDSSSLQAKQIKEKLKEFFEKNYILRKNILNQLENFIEKTYIITKKQDLKSVLSKTSNDELIKLLNFKSIQEIFFRENNIDFRLKSDDQIKLDKLKLEGSDKLDTKQKDLLLSFLEKTSSNSDIFSDEFKFILTLLSKDDKIKLLKFFVPSISLDKLVDLGIYSKEKRNTYKKKILNDLKYSGKIDFEIREENLEKYLDCIDLSTIFIDLESLGNTELENLVENQEIQDKLLKNINQLKFDVSKEEYSSKVDFLESLIPLYQGETRKSPSFRKRVRDTDYINDLFINKIKNDVSMSYLHPYIDKLQNGNFIVISRKDLTTGKIRRSIFKINQVDVGHTLYSKMIKLEDLSSPYGVLQSGEEKKVFYEDFFELLKLPLNEKNPNIKTQIEILSGKPELGQETKLSEFDEYKEKNHINEIDSDYKIKDLIDFKFRIDEVDPDGKNFDISKAKRCSFFVGKPGDKNYGYFSINHITNEGVVLSSKDKNGKNEVMDLTTFFTIFAEKEAKRCDYVGDSNNFFKNLVKTEFFKSTGKEFEFKDSKFMQKTFSKEDAREVQYMVGKNGKAIKIESIGNDNIKVSIGEYKEKKGKNENEIKRVFELSSPQVVSYEDLYTYINENKLLPFLEDEEKPDEIKKQKRSFSITKAWLSMYSVSDLLTGLKMLPKTIEEFLKSGNSIKSAQFAMAFGGLLPDSIRLQLQSNVESQEKKEMEALIAKWTVTDSKDFIPIIRKIILNKSSEEYEKEAALVFFLQKYGVLYRKGLKDLKGTFIWYQAMGGTPNDALYTKYKKDCINRGIPFTEEGLIEVLLDKQSKGELKPKRRSKFAKDYGGYISKGIKEEKDDGELKAGKRLTVKGRIDYAVGQFIDGAYHNGLGALKKIWEKGGSAREMNAIPFLITASGLSQKLTQDSLNDYYALCMTRVFSPIIFSKTQNDIDLYRRVILKVSKSLGVDVEKSLRDALNTKDESKRIQLLAKFWENYGDRMIKKLNINQDPEIFLKKDEDEDFAKYYNKIKSVYGDNSFSPNKGDINDGVYNYDHSSPFMYLGKEYLDSYVSIDTQYGGIKGAEGKIVFWQTIEGYKNISKLNISEEEKKKIFKFYYDAITKRIESSYGDSINTPEKFRLKENANTGTLSIMKKMGLLIFAHHNAKGKSYDEFLEERWLDYKSRYMEQNYKANSVENIKKEQDEVFRDVQDLLSGKYDKQKNNISSKRKNR